MSSIEFQNQKTHLHEFTELENPAFVSHFTNHFVGTECLAPNELLLTEKFSKTRLSHFCTGRFAAKEALKKLGVKSSEILTGKEGEPIWPDGIVGSISHCNELVGAVVNNDPKIRSLGLDIERPGKIKPKMWSNYLTNNEIAFLNQVEDSEKDVYTTLYFSLKESFYKAQFPITGIKLWFTDVEIVNPNNSFQVKVIKDDFELDPGTIQMDSRFVKSNNCIVTSCVII
jgi:4'-phosphopantetheinyl transferase EntD